MNGIALQEKGKTYSQRKKRENLILKREETRKQANKAI